MQKQNLYHDTDYCGIISLCLSYNCPYGDKTMVSDIIMAEYIMSISEFNNSVFGVNIPMNEEEDD